MFYVKNDDMDDMFKKAADEYELNEELAADWNKVLSGIQDKERSLPVAVKKRKGKRILLLFWLLFIPIALLTAYELGLFMSSNKQDKLLKATTEKQPNILHQQPGLNNAISQNDLVTNNKISTSRNISNAINASKNNDTPKSAFSSLHNIKMSGNPTSAQNDVITDDVLKPANLSISQSQKNSYQLNQSSAAGITNSDSGNESKIINNNTILPSKNITQDSALSQQSKQKNKKALNYLRQSFFYAGLLANTDVSFIKDQKISSPALGAGLIGGYHFKNGISIESGLLYDKKNYYTSGKYFDKSKLDYLQSADILTAKGNCNMFEIPLNIKYDFPSHKKYNWFVATGASSYLMHKEYYNFKYNYNGTTGERSYDYYHSTKNWFSILNIGAGVNIQTSNKYLIQVQPYFKTSLKGVGIGNLSLNSAGINFSFSRRIP